MAQAVSRRGALGLGIGAGLAVGGKGRVAIAAPARALRFIPAADLSLLDPLWSTTPVTLSHGYYVFDTIFGVDAQLRPRPQMAAGFTVEADGHEWRIRLREGLRFHDGEPVLARDCVASLRRWSARDVWGQTLAGFVTEWAEADDRTLRIRLRRPFPLLAHALGKPNGLVPFIMPARIAAADPDKPVREMVGSGPYRFLADEFIPGARAAYHRFDAYVPRSEPAEWTSGGKHAHIERIEWSIIGEPATAAAAMQSGGADWLEIAQPDMVPLLRRQPDLVVTNTNPFGYIGVLRFNHLHPPFNNAAIRRAVMAGIAQEDFLRVVTGNDPALYRQCRSFFPCGTDYGTEFAPGAITGGMEEARAALRAAGYAGEKVIILNPADVAGITPLGEVAHGYFRHLGLNVELATSDWGTLVKRRASRETPEKGGWSAFASFWASTSLINPAVNPIIRGLGASGWAGWFSNDTIERLTEQWLVADNEVERRDLVTAMQREATDAVPSVPLGQYFMNTVYRRELLGMVSGNSPYPWNLRWAS